MMKQFGMSRIPSRLPAEKFDKILYLLRKVHDSQLHCIISFNGRVDRGRMARAARLSLDAEPVLGCRFVNAWPIQFWERRVDLDQIMQCGLAVSENVEEDIHRFITTPIDPCEGPQMRALIVRSRTDTLCLKLNHMVTDAGGVKEYAYLLADIYRKVAGNSAYKPKINLHSSRSLDQVYKRFSFLDRLKILSRTFRSWKSHHFPPRNWSMPLIKEKPTGRSVLIRRIDQDQFRLIKRYCKKYSTTVNDIMIASFFRAFFELLKPEPDVPLRLGVTVDLRRYLPTGTGEAMCNLPGVFKLYIGQQLGDSLPDTILRVHRLMNSHKKDFIGLGDYRFFMFGSRWLPFSWASFLCILFLKLNQLISTKEESPGLTNMGIIDDARLNFGDIEVFDAYLTAPVAYPPLFFIGISGFRESITMSTGFCRSAIEEATVEHLLNCVEKELSSLQV